MMTIEMKPHEKEDDLSRNFARGRRRVGYDDDPACHIQPKRRLHAEQLEPVNDSLIHMSYIFPAGWWRMTGLNPEL